MSKADIWWAVWIVFALVTWAAGSDPVWTMGGIIMAAIKRVQYQ